MRAFYDSVKQVNSFFTTKVVILPNNRKYYLEIQQHLIFRCQFFKLFDLNEDFFKVSNELRSISYSKKKMCHLVFMQFPLFQRTTERSNFKQLPSLAFILLLKLFKYFGVKMHETGNLVTYKKSLRNYSRF